MGMKAIIFTLAAASLLLAGCGSTAAPSHPPPSAHLTIAVAPGFIANQHTKRYVLSCTPTAGTVPNPAKACKTLLASPKLLAPLTCHLAADVGSELISGQLNGRHIQRRISPMHLALEDNRRCPGHPATRVVDPRTMLAAPISMALARAGAIQTDGIPRLNR